MELNFVSIQLYDERIIFAAASLLCFSFYGTQWTMVVVDVVVCCIMGINKIPDYG